MSELALCPFYEEEERGVLHCEHRDIKFPSKADRDMWVSMHCNNWNFKICKFYNELMKKYQ